MELFLPQRNIAYKAYKHFKVSATLPDTTENISAQTVTVKKPEFFFIGKNISKIDMLIDIFECGYAVENAKSAIAILKRLAERVNESSAIDVIIIDHVVSDAGMKELDQYLAQKHQYKEVPVVLEVSDLQKDQFQSFRKYRFFDEYISIGRSKDKFMAKVKTMRELKKHSNTHIFQKNIKVSDNFDAIKLKNSSVVKRLFDVVLSSLAIIFLSPVFIIIAIAIKLESRGPVFYISKRAGRGYRVFDFYKYRTMEADADQKVEQLSHMNQYDACAANGPVFFKVSNDPRITKMGAFLRNTSLDELPQLFNVLLGDMSIVGNRPLPLYEAATLTTDEYAVRFMAPAGITGLWQVKKRGDKNMSVKDRVSLDIDYAEKSNFAYDLWIIANTPSALLQKDNV